MAKVGVAVAYSSQISRLSKIRVALSLAGRETLAEFGDDGEDRGGGVRTSPVSTGSTHCVPLSTSWASPSQNGVTNFSVRPGLSLLLSSPFNCDRPYAPWEINAHGIVVLHITNSLWTSSSVRLCISSNYNGYSGSTGCEMPMSVSAVAVFNNSVLVSFRQSALSALLAMPSLSSFGLNARNLCAVLRRAVFFGRS